NSAAWGFAWACIPPSGGTSRVVLANFAITEKTSLTEVIPFGCTDRFAPPVQLTGTVTNLMQSTGGGIFVALFGNRVAQVTVQSGTGAGTFTLNVQPATHDLVIAHAVPLGGGAGDFAIDAAAVARGVVVSGATIAPPV